MANPNWILPIVAVLILGNLRFAQGQSNYTTLATFHGQIPSSLTIDAQGNIFGTTFQPPNGYGGTVFEIKKGSQTVNTIATFEYGFPESIVLDSSGNIFGTSLNTALTAGETIYEIEKGSHTINTLAELDKGSYGPLCLDAQGNIFGTITKLNGPTSFSVFEMKKGDHTLTVLASIHGYYGSESLNLDSQGNIYGTIDKVDSKDDSAFDSKGGSIFEINAVSHQVTTLITFHGEAPGDIILDNNGNIFGTKGNFLDSPHIFELAKGAHAIIPLATFDNSCDNLILDQRGNIFGMRGDFWTKEGHRIFKIGIATHSVMNLSNFHGEIPSVFTLDDQGNIFGLTKTFGKGLYTNANGGTIFEIPHESDAP